MNQKKKYSQEEVYNIVVGWIKDAKYSEYAGDRDSFTKVSSKNSTKDNWLASYFYIYTDTYRYCIRASSNYLGCQVSARKPDAGEDWHRGNDLADGDFSKDTWNKIIADIVGYESVRSSKKIEVNEVVLCSPLEKE
jgi:hypothetical protein